MNAIQKLKSWQPSATDIKDAGKCHCRNKAKMLFYFLDGIRRERTFSDSSVHIEGGYFCTLCDFGNAGSVRAEDYDGMPDAEDK